MIVPVLEQNLVKDKIRDYLKFPPLLSSPKIDNLLLVKYFTLSHYLFICYLNKVVGDILVPRQLPPFSLFRSLYVLCTTTPKDVRWMLYYWTLDISDPRQNLKILSPRLKRLNTVIVFSVPRFEPALNGNRFMAVHLRGLNSLNLVPGVEITVTCVNHILRLISSNPFIPWSITSGHLMDP